MLVPALIFSIPLMIIELRVVYSVPFLRKLILRHKPAAIVMSLMFSFMLNMIIGAAAVTVMFGTVMAIVGTGVVYWFDRQNQHRKSKKNQ